MQSQASGKAEPDFGKQNANDTFYYKYNLVGTLGSRPRVSFVHQPGLSLGGTALSCHYPYKDGIS